MVVVVFAGKVELLGGVAAFLRLFGSSFRCCRTRDAQPSATSLHCFCIDRRTSVSRARLLFIAGCCIGEGEVMLTAKQSFAPLCSLLRTIFARRLPGWRGSKSGLSLIFRPHLKDFVLYIAYRSEPYFSYSWKNSVLHQELCCGAS